MNFIDKAFAQNLKGDDFLQAMADIYSEPKVYKELKKYPRFVADIITVIDYDTALQIDGLDDVISGNLSNRYKEIINALENCGAKDEADVLKKAKESYILDDGSYDKEYNNLSSRLALNNDYDGFWDMVRAYIDRNLS
jgi:hypothetical protein